MMSADNWRDCPKCGAEESVAIYDNDFYTLNKDGTITLGGLSAECRDCDMFWSEDNIVKQEE